MDELDLASLERWREKNRAERFAFVEQHARWLKQQPNKKWSAEQKDFLE